MLKKIFAKEGERRMRSTGIVRRVDRLGRIVIPMEIRNTKNMQEGTPLELFIHGDELILRKYTPGCSICATCDDIKTIEGISLCKECLSKFTK